jgi:hypothetical protein
MANMTERLAFLISANADQAVRAFEKTGKSAEKELGKAEDKIGKLGSQLTIFGAGAMAFAGVAAGGLYKMAQASEEAEAQSRKLANSIANNGSYAEGAQRRLEDLAESIMKVTAADDDAIIGAQSLLVQFGLTENQVTTLTPLIVDLSRKMNVDMTTAAMAVGKSVEGSATALRKMGILVEAAGTSGDAFTNTVDALRSTVGGFAQEEAETFSGKMERLKVALGNLAEGVGSGVVDVFGGIADVAVKASSALGNLSPQAQNAAGRFMAVGTAAIGAAGAISFVAGQVVKMRARFVDGAGGLTAFGKAAKFTTIGLGALGVALTIIEANQASNASAYEGVTKAIETMGGAADAQLPKMFEMTQALLSLAGKSSDAGATLREIASNSVSTAQRFIELGIVTDQFGLSVVEATAIVANQIQTNRRAAETARDDADATGELTEATDDATEAAEKFVVGVDGETQALKEYKTAIEKADEAARNMLDTQLTAFESQFAYNDQVRDTAEAFTNWQTVSQNVKATEEEKAIALDEASQSALDQAEAARDLRVKWAEANGETVSAAQEQAILKQELWKLALSLDKNDPLRKNIEGYVGDLGEVPTEVHTAITADDAEAQVVMDGWERRLIAEKATSAAKGREVGQAAADGIAAGVRERDAFIKRTMTEYVRSMIAAAKEGLDIRSPSQVMADEVGKPVSEGIAEGVQDGAGLVADALDDVGDTIVRRAGEIVEQSTDEIARVLEEAESAFDEVKDLIEGRRDHEDAARRVEDAERDLVEAEQDVQQALQESGADSDDYRRAQERLEDAQRDLEDANYRLLQISFDLIEQGPAGVAMFQNIAQAAGLTRDEIQRLIDKYRELAEAQQAAEDAEAIQRPIQDAEDNINNQVNYQAELDSAISSYQQKLAEFNTALSKGLSTASIENEMASLAIKASQAYASSLGHGSGTSSYYKAQLDLLRYLVSNQPFLLDNLSSYVKAIEASVPGYATGGIVTRPHLAMVGEKGPEAIIPLSKMGTERPMVVNIHVNGADPNQVVDALKRYARQNGAIPVRTMNP